MKKEPHTMKECPCHLLWLESKLLGIIMYNETNCGFVAESRWQHNTLNGTMSLWAWCSLPFAPHYRRLSTQKSYSDFQWSIVPKFATSDIHSACGCASQTLHKAQSRGGCLSKLWPCTRSWGGCSFVRIVYVVVSGRNQCIVIFVQRNILFT